MIYFLSNKLTSFHFIQQSEVAMGKAAKVSPKAKVTSANSKAADKASQEVHEDQGTAETASVGSPAGSAISELSREAVHKKRKAFLGQLRTANKADTEEIQLWKQRKLEEYHDASKMRKIQILSGWISNDSRLKQWKQSQASRLKQWKQRKASMIAELKKLKPDKSDGDQERLEFLLEQLKSRPCLTSEKTIGDNAYFHYHMLQSDDFENNISTASKVHGDCDIKEKLVDPQWHGDGMWLTSKDKPKCFKLSNPFMNALMKEILKAKIVVCTGLALLPCLVLLKRQLTDQGQEMCDQAEKSILQEAGLLAEIYGKAEKMLKDEQEMDHQDMMCQITAGMNTFNDKIGGLKNLKSELKDMFILKAFNQG